MRKKKRKEKKESRFSPIPLYISTPDHQYSWFFFSSRASHKRKKMLDKYSMSLSVKKLKELENFKNLPCRIFCIMVIFAPTPGLTTQVSPHHLHTYLMRFPPSPHPHQTLFLAPLSSPTP